MSTLYRTESQITYDSQNSNLTKKLKDICNEIDVFMVNANQKFSSLFQSQQNSFYKAFKLVIQQMSADFKNVQQKFDEYITYHENETDVAKNQNKLVFFRDECQVLNKLCIDLKNQNKELKQKINELEQEINNHKFILVKQIDKNSKINEEIQIMKLQLQQSQHNQQLNRNYDQYQIGEKNLKIPHLKLNNRHQTELTDYDHQSNSTFSQKNQIINLQKETRQKKNLSQINQTSEPHSSKYQFDKFFEKSYNSRAISQQNTLKKLHQSDIIQRIPQKSYSNLRYKKANTQHYKSDLSISS